jgi:phosphocarrier protein FPr/phosphocarrier protein
MSLVELKCPLAGWVGPLSEVADPVFAEQMMGDGLAIDPTGSRLYAPCDGQVLSVHRAGHAVTLRCTGGAELLIHVGLETVALNGEGFERHVEDGQTVRAGDPLISFDLDLLAGRAKGLITPVVLANSDLFEIVHRISGRELEVGDALLTLRKISGAAPAGEGTADLPTEAVRTLEVALEHGVHARPAAALAACARRFTAEIVLRTADRGADARSVVGLMTLGLRKGDSVTVRARGLDAAEACAALADLLTGGLHEVPASPPPAPPAPPPPTSAPANDDPKRLRGVAGSPGLAVGPAFRFAAADLAAPETGQGPEVEAAALTRARAEARARLARGATGADRHRREILEAHAEMLDDPDLVGRAAREIAAGASAGRAWRAAARASADALRALDDPRLNERAADLLDVERQVLAVLYGASSAAPVPPEGAILLADELLPSELAGLDAARIAGICTAGGGPTSHVAILAASMGVPALVAAGPRVLAIPDGAPLILDADRGELHLQPEPWEVEALRTALAARRRRAECDLARAPEPALTADGRRVEVFANLGAAAEAARAVNLGAEGCGLLRTEFLFLERETAPGEDEQAAQYQAVVDGLGARPLVIRTLDAGGDKPLAYLPLPHEENPALGLRGVRTSLWRPDLLRIQLRAILRVRPLGAASIMLPMVASIGELRAVRAALESARAELGLETTPPLGLMIETPASALLAEPLAAEADFFSIGTNDLTQYVLAMDRTNPQLAAQADALHPAVLRAIDLTAKGARVHRRPVSVCGGLASDPVAVPILVGLGVFKLSVTPAMAPRIKALIRTLDGRDCQAAAQAALDLHSAAEVRALARARWPELAEGRPGEAALERTPG